MSCRYNRFVELTYSYGGHLQNYNGRDFLRDDAALEGVPNINGIGVSLEDYTIYTVLNSSGKTTLIGLDINNDGVIDYVK